MEKTISEKLLLNLIIEHYEKFKSNYISMLSCISGNDQASKYQSIKRLNETTNSIAKILSQKDRPVWLTQTLNFTEGYLRVHKTPDVVVSGKNWKLSQEAWKIHHSAVNHNWNFSQKNLDNYDFDDIYRKYRESSDLSTLFDSLIEVLTKMINANEIDSLRMISALEELIAMLSKNKDSSYFSTMASWDFLKSFMTNFAWEQVNSIKTIKHLRSAFEKTVSDMDIEMEQLHKNIKKEMRERHEIVVQDALGYNKNKPKLMDSK